MMARVLAAVKNLKDRVFKVRDHCEVIDDLYTKKRFAEAGTMAAQRGFDISWLRQFLSAHNAPVDAVKEALEAYAETSGSKGTKDADPQSMLGKRVRFTTPGVNGEMTLAGTVKFVRPDGTLEVKSQQGGYYMKKVNEVETLDAAQDDFPSEAKPFKSEQLDAALAKARDLAHRLTKDKRFKDTESRLDTEAMDELYGKAEEFARHGKPEANFRAYATGSGATGTQLNSLLVHFKEMEKKYAAGKHRGDAKDAEERQYRGYWIVRTGDAYVVKKSLQNVAPYLPTTFPSVQAAQAAIDDLRPGRDAAPHFLDRIAKIKDQLGVTADVSVRAGKTYKQLAQQLRQAAESDARGSGRVPKPGHAHGEPDEFSIKSARRLAAMAEWLESRGAQTGSKVVTEEDITEMNARFPR